MSAGTRDSAGVIATAIYVDNRLVKKTRGERVTASAGFGAGRHLLVAQLWDHAGRIIKQQQYFTVATSLPVVTVAFSPGTTSKTSQASATPKTSSASSSSNTGASGNQSSTAASPSPIAVAMTTSSSSATSESTDPSRPARPDRGSDCGAGAAPSMTICMPATGSSTNSPVQIVAMPASNNGVAAIAVYVDNNLAYKQNVQTLDTDINMTNGSHYVVAQFWDDSGNVPAKASVTITVNGTGGGGTPGTVDVLTSHNDPSRQGANTQETILNPSNVNTSQFGKLMGYAVDGQVYAQPLIVSNLNIGGGNHNVLYVSTEHDSIYALDADGQQAQPFWSMTLLGPGQSTVQSEDGLGISPEVGSTSTPVIDRNNNVMYVVAYVNNGGTDEFWLHALNLQTGAELFGGPKRITATVSGTGGDSSNGQISLEGDCWQRSGLALANGNVYIGFGHCNHGWLLAYNATSLQQTAVYNTSPSGSGGTIWMGGGAPAIDSSGNVYVMTGTNFGDTQNSGYNNSFLKLSPSLTLLDFFQPSNNATLVANDADLGSGSPMIIPDNSSAYPHEIVGAGKDGRIFLLNRDSMGSFDPNGNHVIQSIQSGSSQYNNFHDTPAFWNGNVYYHANGDVLRVFHWSNGMLSTSPTMTGSTVFSAHGDTPSISASGTSNGIVWELQLDGQPSQPAVLHAYDANDVSRELWNSSMNSGDAAGPAVKFTVPTIANGKVYVPAGNQVDIYGPK